MANWSSIRELYRLYQPEINRYGFFLFGVVIGMLDHQWKLAGCFFVAIVTSYSFDRWGRPWAERGRLVMKSKSRPPEKPQPPPPPTEPPPAP